MSHTIIIDLRGVRAAPRDIREKERIANMQRTNVSQLEFQLQKQFNLPFQRLALHLPVLNFHGKIKAAFKEPQHFGFRREYAQQIHFSMFMVACCWIKFNRRQRLRWRFKSNCIIKIVMCAASNYTSEKIKARSADIHQQRQPQRASL